MCIDSVSRCFRTCAPLLLDPSGSPHKGPLYTWCAIAACMAATVRSEIFLPLVHVALVFQLDARNLQLLALALLVETDPSIAGAFAALTRTLDETDPPDEASDHDRPATTSPRRTPKHRCRPPRLYPREPIRDSALLCAYSGERDRRFRHNVTVAHGWPARLSRSSSVACPYLSRAFFNRRA